MWETLHVSLYQISDISKIDARYGEFNESLFNKDDYKLVKDFTYTPSCLTTDEDMLEYLELIFKNYTDNEVIRDLGSSDIVTINNRSYYYEYNGWQKFCYNIFKEAVDA